MPDNVIGDVFGHALHKGSADCRIERFDAQLDALIDPQIGITCLGDEFLWTEGPAWDARRQCLYFSDIPNNRIHLWSQSGGVETYLDPAGRAGHPRDLYASPGTNGLWITHGDHLLICNQDDRSVDQINLESGERRVLARRYKGARFNSPNDVIRASSGHVYFTDPPFGLKDQDDYAGRDLDFQGVFRIDPAGRVKAVISDMDFPNGLVFSPDEVYLYVSQSDVTQPVVKRFKVMANGDIGPGEVFFNAMDFRQAGDKGLPDGMTIDQSGHLYATVPGGVAILAPSGKLLGRIATGAATSNCTFGGDGHTLFITAHNRLLSVRTKACGLGFAGDLSS